MSETLIDDQAAMPAPADADAERDVVLEVTDLRTEFGSVDDPIRAVRGASLRLRRGRTLVLLGESGSGKSVLARSALRLYGRNARITGAVHLESLDLLAADERTLRRVRAERLALVPQDPSGALDPLRSVGSQLVEVLRAHGMAETKQAARERAIELLQLVGIPDPERNFKAYPHQLSGGMRQRVVIAIGVSCNPQVLIADEPTTALDVTVQAQILELFQELQRTLDMAILMVTHDVGVAREFGDEVAVMYAGRIVEQGPATAVLDAPCHPYTAALLASVPVPGLERGSLTPIPGRAILAGERIVGCPFAPRCTRTSPTCWSAEPDLEPVRSSGRLAACHHPVNVDEEEVA